MTGRALGMALRMGLAVAGLGGVAWAFATFDGFPGKRGLHRPQNGLPSGGITATAPRRSIIADQVFNERRRPGSGPAWPKQRVIFAVPMQPGEPSPVRRPDLGQWVVTPEAPPGWERP